MLFVLSFYSLGCKSQDICQKEFYGASASIEKVHATNSSKAKLRVKVVNICTEKVRIIIQIFNSETNSWMSAEAQDTAPGATFSTWEITNSTTYRWAVVKLGQSSYDVTDWHNQ